MIRPNDLFEQLASGYFEGTLAATEFDALKQMFIEDERRVERFAELAQLHQMIISEITYRRQADRFNLSRTPLDSASAMAMASLADRAEDEPVVPINFSDWREARRETSRSAQRNRLFVLGGAVAAALVLMAVLAVVLFSGPASDQSIAQTPGPTPPSPVVPAETATFVATLTAERGAKWQALPGTFSPGVNDGLVAGQRLTLVDGFAEITTKRGAIALLEAPATIEFTDDDNALRLHHGKMVGICETEFSKGFVVSTPQMVITDLGTRFGVDATDPYVTETHVIEGVVSVSRGVGEAQRVEAGQAAVAQDAVASVALVPSDTTRFMAVLPKFEVLSGTGVGLTAGEADPDWLVVGIGDDLLDEPVVMKVTDHLALSTRLSQAVPGVKYLTLTEAIVPNVTDYISDKRIRYKVRTTLELPTDFDASRDQFVMQFEAEERLLSVRVNGQTHPAPPNKLEPADPQLFRMLIPSHDLRAGANAIELEIEDLMRANNFVWGLGVAWHLEQLDKDQP